MFAMHPHSSPQIHQCSSFHFACQLAARGGICGSSIVNWTNGQCSKETKDEEQKIKTNGNITFDHSAFEVKISQQGFRTLH